MKRLIVAISIIFALLIVSGVLSDTSCFADSPQIINYQGRLTDAGDNPLTGSYNITFKLWSHQTSVEAQYYEWAESHSPVTVIEGLFNVVLGSVNTDTLGAVFNANDTLYMEIEVGGETLSPRVKMGSAGYALEAIPSGVIVMWSGQTDTIPDGWALCDGTDGTPDLRTRFVLGACGTVDGHNIQPHECNPISPMIKWDGSKIWHDSGTNSKAEDSGTCTAQHVDMMPPYYALAFIMKKYPD